MSKLQIITIVISVAALIAGIYVPLHIFCAGRFNNAAETFRNTLIPSINKIDRGQYVFDVIKADFPTHGEAMLRFVQHIKSKALCSFEKDWNEYENWYQDICCCDISEHIYSDDVFKKKKSINPSMFLNKLLVHAAPR